MNDLNEIITLIITHQYFWEFLVTFLGLFSLWLLIRLLFPSPRQKNIIAFNSGNGVVSISRKAISDLIQKAADQTGSIQRCQVKLIPKRKYLNLRLKITLKANVQLKELEQKLNYTISETLRATLGIDNLQNIDIVVSGFAGKPEIPYQAVNNTATETEFLEIETDEITEEVKDEK